MMIHRQLMGMKIHRMQYLLYTFHKYKYPWSHHTHLDWNIPHCRHVPCWRRWLRQTKQYSLGKYATNNQLLYNHCCKCRQK